MATIQPDAQLATWLGSDQVIEVDDTMLAKMRAEAQHHQLSGEERERWAVYHAYTHPGFTTEAKTTPVQHRHQGRPVIDHKALAANIAQHMPPREPLKTEDIGVAVNRSIAAFCAQLDLAAIGAAVAAHIHLVPVVTERVVMVDKPFAVDRVVEVEKQALDYDMIAESIVSKLPKPEVITVEKTVHYPVPIPAPVGDNRWIVLFRLIVVALLIFLFIHDLHC